MTKQLFVFYYLMMGHKLSLIPSELSSSIACCPEAFLSCPCCKCMCLYSSSCFLPMSPSARCSNNQGNPLSQHLTDNWIEAQCQFTMSFHKALQPPFPFKNHVSIRVLLFHYSFNSMNNILLGFPMPHLTSSN